MEVDVARAHLAPETVHLAVAVEIGQRKRVVHHLGALPTDVDPLAECVPVIETGRVRVEEALRVRGRDVHVGSAVTGEVARADPPEISAVEPRTDLHQGAIGVQAIQPPLMGVHQTLNVIEALWPTPDPSPEPVTIRLTACHRDLTSGAARHFRKDLPTMPKRRLTRHASAL
ncbi:hypothetical protein [Streptomyces malaysiensis]|uniref:hypothetical protein n=1 Tax=Streptomyces malaysiensis TaxID=92644 RepID=UPI00368B1EBC